jgi:hypothetical protein
MKGNIREFLVIVLGVLVALLGESLVSDVRDARLAQEHRESLIADLQRDLDRLEAELFYYEGIIRAGVQTRDWLRGGAAAGSESQVLAYAVNAAEVSAYAPASETWDDLKSTGEINLLDREERRVLAGYYRLYLERGLMVEVPGGYRETIFSVVPAELAGEVLRACRAGLGSDAAQPPRCSEDFGDPVHEVLT